MSVWRTRSADCVVLTYGGRIGNGQSSWGGCDFGLSAGSRDAQPQRLAGLRSGSESEVSDGAKSEVQRK
jgi:hypothetical protein